MIEGLVIWLSTVAFALLVPVAPAPPPEPVEGSLKIDLHARHLHSLRDRTTTVEHIAPQPTTCGTTPRTYHDITLCSCGERHCEAVSSCCICK